MWCNSSDNGTQRCPTCDAHSRGSDVAVYYQHALQLSVLLQHYPKGSTRVHTRQQFTQYTAQKAATHFQKNKL
jgi:hypothetical protein